MQKILRPRIFIKVNLLPRLSVSYKILVHNYLTWLHSRGDSQLLDLPLPFLLSIFPKGRLTVGPPVSQLQKTVVTDFKPPSQNFNDMVQGTISRAALGSVAKLGDLYDARRDKLCSISILKDSAPESAIVSRDSPFSDTKYFHSDSYTDTFEKLGVKAELKLSVLCGLFSLEGSGRYFQDEKSSKRAVRCTLMYNICTKVEELNIYNDALKECIALDAFQQEATHVVIGITWGANLMVTAEYKNEENADTMEVAGALKAELNKVSFAISGKAEVDYGKGGLSKGKEFSLNIYGDVLPDGDLPQTIEGATELMKKLPTLVQRANDGKGKPLQYVLLPVDLLKSHFDIQMKADSIVKSLSESTILRVVQLFDDINDARQQLNDLHTDVVKFGFCILDSTKKMLADLKLKADISEADIRAKLSKLLVKVRSGKAAPFELEDLRKQYEEDPNSAWSVLRTVHDEFADVSDKISLYKLLTNKFAVKFVPKSKRRLGDALLDHYGKDIYILFSNAKDVAVDQELWSKQLYFFLSLIEEQKLKEQEEQSGTTLKKLPVFLYVDLDVAPQLSPPGNQFGVVQHFKNDQCLSKDLLKHDNFRANGECLSKGLLEDANLRANGKCLSKSLLKDANFRTNEKSRPTRTGQPHRCEWIAMEGGAHPEFAVEVGTDSGNKVYVARGYYEGAIVPGKLHIPNSHIHIPYGTLEIVLSCYEILIAPPASLCWVRATGGDVPGDAIVGGQDQDGETYYIGRVSVDGAMTSGKVHPSHGVCFVPYGCKELAFTEYEVLSYR